MRKILLLVLAILIFFTSCDIKSNPVSYKDNMYFIMVDRFNDADENLPDVDITDPKAYQGGDIRGIIQKLDYIKDLGMTAIWLTPIMDNADRGYHGYWIYDFYSVDEHFGTLDDFKELVEEAHKRDLKVILDYVVNHMGENSPWLLEPTKADWFHEDRSITNWGDKEQVQNGWIFGLPDLNHENPEVSGYLIENAKWWIKETGIDGFRLDTVRHVPNEFWELFIKEIKADYPDFYLLGEVWHHNARVLKVYQNLGMDGITNYSLYEGIRVVFGPYGDMKDFSKLLRDESVFADPTLNSVFIDNHDNPRFYNSSEEFNFEHMKQALAFVYTYPAVSTMYYGTEAMLEGAYDPVNRGFMPWSKEGELIEYIKWLVELKKTYTESFEVISYNQKNLAYKIGSSGNEMLIIMNIDTKVSIVEVPFTGKLKDYINGEEIQSAETFNLEMEPVETRFFIIE